MPILLWQLPCIIICIGIHPWLGSWYCHLPLNFPDRALVFSSQQLVLDLSIASQHLAGYLHERQLRQRRRGWHHGGLSISVSGPSSQATQLVSEITTAARSTLGSSRLPSERGFPTPSFHTPQRNHKAFANNQPANQLGVQGKGIHDDNQGVYNPSLRQLNFCRLSPGPLAAKHPGKGAGSGKAAVLVERKRSR